MSTSPGETTTTRSFDFDVETTQGTQYTFSSIEREDGKLFDFVSAKKLNIKNRGLKEGMNPSYDECAASDEDQHDAGLERMEEEGKVREEHANDSSEDSGEETDELLDPGEGEEDVAEESDSNASASSSSNDGDCDREEKKRRQLKKAKMAKARKSRKKPLDVKKGKDPTAPKRPMSAYMLWLSASREKIKVDHRVSASPTSPRRRARPGRECPRRRRSGIARLRMPGGNMKKP